MTTQPLDDLEALADRRPEVPGAFDEVALVEVVRPDPVGDQLMDQRALDVDAIVDAGEQHALVPDPGQLVDGTRDLGRDLVGMVEVEVDPQRVVLLEHRAKLVIDPLRQEDRHARADPDDLDVGDLAQPAQDRSNSFGASVGRRRRRSARHGPAVRRR